LEVPVWRVALALLDHLVANVPDERDDRWHARLGAGLLALASAGELLLFLALALTQGLASAATALVGFETWVLLSSLLLLRTTGRYRLAVALGLLGTAIYLGGVTGLVGLSEGALAVTLLATVLAGTFVLGHRWTWPTVLVTGGVQVASVLVHHGTASSELPAVLGLVASLAVLATFLYFIERSRERAFERALQRDEAEHAAQAARAVAQAKDQFLATMSHEIRTPMNGVLNVNRLLSDTYLDEEQRLLVDTAIHSGEALLAVLNDVLDFSRIESGEVVLEQVRFDLHRVIEDVVRLLGTSAEDRGVKVHERIGPMVPRFVTGDPTRVRQVLTNLVSNAVKFTHRGHVWIRADRLHGDGIVIEVEDTGIGIPPEHLPRLFDAFTQADTSTTRKYGGTGLGLSISKRLCTMMGGDITVESAFGEGSTFRVQLPLPAAEPPSIVADPDEGPDVAGLRVLLAEDNAVNRLVMLRVLEPMGVCTRVVEDGRFVVDALRDDPVDVILMDLHMPEVDGLDATRAVRALPEPLCHVPIVALTASALDTDRQRCLEAGMDDHLAKPVHPQDLARTLARWAHKGREHGMRSHPEA